MSDIDEASEQLELPPSLRWLRNLVTVLTVVMIAGMVLIVGVLFVKLQDASVAIPDELELPQDAVPEAITQASDWIGVVTQDGRIFIFDKANGALRQEITLRQD